MPKRVTHIGLFNDGSRIGLVVEVPIAIEWSAYGFCGFLVDGLFYRGQCLVHEEMLRQGSPMSVNAA